MTKSTKKLIIVGSYPPPIGGVSIHIQRLSQYLQQSGLEHLCIDISGVNDKSKELDNVLRISWKAALLYLFLHERNVVLHLHNFSFRNIVFYFLLSFRHTVVLSFHNERFLDILVSHGKLLAVVTRLLINRVHYVVVDSNFCVALAEKIIRDKSKIVMIPEFIPPGSILPIDNIIISDFRKKHRYLLSSNAFQIAFYKGEDLYGLDILVQLVDRLVNGAGMDVGLVFLLPNVGDERYFAYIKKEILRLKLAENVMIVTEPVYGAMALWKMSDAVVRATNTDGNSLTVMEALYVGVPVIASDCSERPKGVVVFETRNVDDLYEKVSEILLNQEYYRREISNIGFRSNAQAFLGFYRSIVK